ncbi:hypothetical protein LJ737_26730 [Hymenobacter sp. 15J16-1T3B]|uniref:hypothetical protein n=1 Tax=Hymenobacter sp. 15J16-1T3B TaxID=2886941 RepID=UPI001D103911|nr:hypothetical protein [Hymenobacter sp. 15J16-1T3B]MCC3160862.1 hypothetical protein [Hymenobacter sp. 15J16-1T3B]
MLNDYSWGRGLLLSSFALLPACPGWAQASADSLTLASSINHLHARYLEARKQESFLLNGVAYAPNLPPRVIGHPFLESPEPQPGRVYYDGYDFPNLSLLFDVEQDALVLADLGGPLRVRLISEHVGNFRLGTRSFVWLRGAKQAGMNTGFYEVLFDDAASPVRLLARHGKKLERKSGTELRYEFRTSADYFLQTPQGYVPVSKASAVVATLPERKKELKEFVRSHHLKFSKAERAASLTSLVAYYDSLVKAARP